MLVTPSEARALKNLEKKTEKTEISDLDTDNKLNLISKFREKQIAKFKEQQKMDRKLYIREQIAELEQDFTYKIDNELK